MSNNLILKGAANASGGQFDKVIISGSGNINGDIECEEFECNGKGKLVGDLKAREIEVDGNCKILGKITSDELEVHGVSKIDGYSKINEIDVDGRIVFCDELEANGVNVDGECKVFENIQANKLNVNGFLSAGKNCESKLFATNGKLNINGRLTAETIDVKLFWDSKVNEISGHKVVIGRVDKFLVKLISKIIRPSLEVDTIEAEDIHISLTKAKVVRGKDITIGDGCEIDLVEYKGNLICSKKAKVGKAVKIENKM